MGLLAAALGFALYMNTIGHQYVLDDYSTIKSNWIVKSGLNAESVKLILTTEYRYGAWNSPGSLYRPIPLLMFAAEWQLWPDDPRVGHILNVLLYAFTGWLLWITWRRILSNQSEAMVAATILLFMAHPVHTEVVANIKSRDEILSLLFSMGALYAIWRHLEQGSRRWLASAVGLYGLALFSKESAITLLAVIPLTLWFFSDIPWTRNLRISALMLAPAVLYLVIRHQVLQAQPFAEVYSPLDSVYMATKDRGEQLATAFKMSGRYLRTLVIPHPLVSELGYPQVKPVGFGDWRALAGLAALAGLFVVAIRGLQRRHFMSYAILFFLLTYSLFSNIFMIIGTSYGERLLYLPSLGFSFMLAYALAWAIGIHGNVPRWPAMNGHRAFWGACAVILTLYSIRTLTRNPAWYSSGTLYLTDLPQAPNSAKLNFHHGIEVIKDGLDETSSAVTDTAKVMEAIGAQTRAIELFPKNPDALHARGQAWLRLGALENAEADILAAIKLRLTYGEAYSNLGVIHFTKRNYTAAETAFRDALRHDPKLIDAYRNLGAVLATTGRFQEAIAQWQLGLRYEPGNGTLLSFIGSAYKDMGQPDKAAYWQEKARQADRKR